MTGSLRHGVSINLRAGRWAAPEPARVPSGDGLRYSADEAPT
jgi:hypothetical protein